jgi:uncharacterized protein (DUF362 family)
MSKDFTRREMIGTVALAGLGLAVAPPAAAPTVALIKGDPSRALRRAVEVAGGIGRYVPKGSTVVIKVSMGFPTAPEMGASVSPGVVAEMATICREAGASRVLVIDHPCRKPEVCLKVTGIGEACGKLPDTYAFAITDDTQFAEIPVTRGITLRKTAVLKDLLKPGVVHINLATAKSHGSATVSLCIKNLMGAILARETFHKDHELNQAIADLATAIKCDLCVVDGTRALVTGGPAGPGTVEQVGAIVAGTNIVAVDSVAVTLAKWYGRTLAPRDIRHILLAEKAGLGPADLSRINIVSEKV